MIENVFRYDEIKYYKFFYEKSIKILFLFFSVFTEITHRDLLFNDQQIFIKKISSDFKWFFNMLSTSSYIEYWNIVKKIYLVVFVFELKLLKTY